MEKVTGQPWGDYLREKVFQPSGMNSTYPTNTKESIPKGLDGPPERYKKVRHGGSLRGFRSEFARIVDDGLTIIILMNAEDVDWASIVRGVAAQYLPAPTANSK